MKNTLLLICLLCTIHVFAQNDLLLNSITGEVPANGRDIEFISTGDNTVLVYGGTNDKIYAIDYNDSSPEGVTDWEVNQIPNITSSLADILGTNANNVTIVDMEVNPVTKAVFILAYAGSSSSDAMVFEVRSETDISLVDFTDVTYAEITFTFNDNELNDMAYSPMENKLYYCQGTFSLDASIGYVSIPFEHNTTAEIKATSMFKSNWGGDYFTDAPLERFTNLEVNGESRIVGVTTCAPGFSIATSEINEATTVMEVTEDFNVNYDPSLKVVTVKQMVDGELTSFLFDLHDDFMNGGQLIRIGEKYLTGEVTAVNNAAQEIRTSSGSITPSLDEIDAKELAIGYFMIAFYDNNNLMVVDDQDVLRLLDVDVEAEDEPVNTHNLDLVDIRIAPNPAQKFLDITIESTVNGQLTYEIYNTIGQQVQQSNLVNTQIDIQQLITGDYVLIIKGNNEIIGRKQFIKL